MLYCSTQGFQKQPTSNTSLTLEEIWRSGTYATTNYQEWVDGVNWGLKISAEINITIPSI